MYITITTVMTTTIIVATIITTTIIELRSGGALAPYVFASCEYLSSAPSRHPRLPICGTEQATPPRLETRLSRCPRLLEGRPRILCREQPLDTLRF